MVYFNIRDEHDRPLQGEIVELYLQKLNELTGISEFGTGLGYTDILGIPFDAVGVEGTLCSQTLQFILDSCGDMPLDGGKSLHEIGYAAKVIKEIPDDDLKQILAEHFAGMRPIMEGLLYKNMTNEERAHTFANYLEGIGSAGKELIITDSYLFATGDDWYVDFLTKILKLSHAKEVISIVKPRAFKQDIYDKVVQRLNSEPCYERDMRLLEDENNLGTSPMAITVRYADDIHDRFWIAGRSKGFVSGTSFNGVGKQLSYINYLTEEDVADLVDAFQAYL